MVLASGFTSSVGASAWLVQRWRNDGYVLVVSEHILQELVRTLREDRYFAARTMPSFVTAILARLGTSATMTLLTIPVVGVATHPEDDLVLSTALSGQASVLCTRDKQLLKLRSFQTVAILSPGELPALLEAEAPA